VLLYELLLGESPFEAESDGELFSLILNQPIELPERVPAATKSMLMGFLNRDETKRLGCGPNGFNNVKQHP
jgi:serine/threonine protein kinase